MQTSRKTTAKSSQQSKWTRPLLHVTCVLATSSFGITACYSEDYPYMLAMLEHACL